MLCCLPKVPTWCLFYFHNKQSLKDSLEKNCSWVLNEQWWWIVLLYGWSTKDALPYFQPDHSSSPSQISNTPRGRFEPVQNLSSGFDEWNRAVVITTTPRRQNLWLNYEKSVKIICSEGVYFLFYPENFFVLHS